MTIATLDTHPATIKPGDYYWAKKNGPGRVLICYENNLDRGWIVAALEQNAYLYDYCDIDVIDATKYTKAELDALVVSTTAEYNEWLGRWHRIEL
jgi:hypothetical protein